MAKEIILFSQIDPEVLEARETATKLLIEFRKCTDPLTKKVFKEMVYDALDREAELRLRSRAKEAVNMLHELETPGINLN